MTHQSNPAPTLHSILLGGHYVALSLRERDNEDGTFAGEVRAYSYLGDFGGMLAASEVPLKQRLANMDMSTFFAMCDGTVHLVFDGPASVEKLGTEILNQRRRRCITAELACELWGDLQFCRDAVEQSELSFRGLATRLCALEPKLGLPATLAMKTLSPQAKQFWNTVWPELVRLLDGNQKPASHQLAA